MKLVRGSQFNSNKDVYKFLQPMGQDVAHAGLLAGAERADRHCELPARHVERHADRQNRELTPTSRSMSALRDMRSLHEKVDFRTSWWMQTGRSRSLPWSWPTPPGNTGWIMAF